MNTPASLARVFPDSNVFIEGLVSHWGAGRAILVLARLKSFRLLLSPYVELEVEEYLFRRLRQDYAAGSQLVDSYHLALQLINPERLPEITAAELHAHRALIRHSHDVPVLVTALKAKPDWLITSNTEHFNAEVAARTGLRIVTPHEFLHLFKL